MKQKYKRLKIVCDMFFHLKKCRYLVQVLELPERYMHSLETGKIEENDHDFFKQVFTEVDPNHIISKKLKQNYKKLEKKETLKK